MARKEFQTLSEQMYYVLLVLQKAHHGYEIMQIIEQMTQGRIRVGAGTLYALLLRFEEEGFIRIIKHDGRRKIYQITKEGNDLLMEEYHRLNAMIRDLERSAKEV